MSSAQRPRAKTSLGSPRASLLSSESPLPRWSSSASSWGTFLQRKAGKGTALLIGLLLLIGFFSINRGETGLKITPHRKLGGHDPGVNFRFSPDVIQVIGEDNTIKSLESPGKRIQSPGKLSSTEKKRIKVNRSVAQRLPPPRGLYALHALDIDGNDVSFSDYAGKVLLILNVASACGYTEQNYKGLQALYEKYGSYGLEIIAFPSNQFGGQEPGSEEHIKEFVTSRYGVTFKMMSKVDVNGPQAHPVFKYLKQNLSVDQGGGGGVAPGNDLVWNFNKFLVDKHGRPVAFYYQNFDAGRLEADVFTYLSAT